MIILLVQSKYNFWNLVVRKARHFLNANYSNSSTAEARWRCHVPEDSSYSQAFAFSTPLTISFFFVAYFGGSWQGFVFRRKIEADSLTIHIGRSQYIDVYECTLYMTPIFIQKRRVFRTVPVSVHQGSMSKSSLVIDWYTQWHRPCLCDSSTAISCWRSTSSRWISSMSSRLLDSNCSVSCTIIKLNESVTLFTQMKK